MTDDEQRTMADIHAKVTELVKWKDTINELLYGSSRGEFGYFHKSNILWRIIILWPVLVGSIATGAGITLLVQHLFSR